jgi:hypothetical protein
VDATNADTTRLRAMLRARVIPLLKDGNAGAVGRIVESAEACREAGEFVASAAVELADRSGLSAENERRVYRRDVLRQSAAIVVGELLRQEVRALGLDLDRLTRRALMRTVEAIRSISGETRVHRVGGAAVRIGRAEVTITRAESLA